MRAFNVALAASAVAVAAIAAPASAVITTFATFSAPTSAANVYFANSGNSVNRTTDATFFTTTTKTSKTPGAVAVRFSFLQTLIAPFVDNVTAAFTLNASIAKGTPAVGSTAAGFTQSGLTGSFSFLSTSAITVSGPSFTTHTYAAGSNLLSGVFTSSRVTGSGSSGSELDSNLTPGSSLTYTSDFLDFNPTVQRDLSFAITSILPSLSRHAGANGALSSFRANLGGQFSSDPAPLINGVVVVPEPGVWMLMVAGFGLVGFSARRRRPVVAA